MFMAVVLRRDEMLQSTGDSSLGAEIRKSDMSLAWSSALRARRGQKETAYTHQNLVNLDVISFSSNFWVRWENCGCKLVDSAVSLGRGLGRASEVCHQCYYEYQRLASRLTPGSHQTALITHHDADPG